MQEKIRVMHMHNPRFCYQVFTRNCQWQISQV